MAISKRVPPSSESKSPDHVNPSVVLSSLSPPQERPRPNMPPLTVLTDRDVRKVLLDLTEDEIKGMQNEMAEALHTYSTGTQEQSACHSNQPLRTMLATGPDRTTIVMPARTGTSVGVKMVTLAESKPCTAADAKSPRSPSTPSMDTLSLSSSPSFSSTDSTSSTGRGSFDSGVKSSASSLSNTTSPSSTSSSKPFSPTTARTATPTQSSTTSLPLSAIEATTSPSGSLTLLTPSGTPYALLNATTLTAFRTALATSLLLRKRTHARNLTVFGAGAQAYWHIRLALQLRGPEIKHVNIITRSFSRASELIKTLHNEAAEHHEWRRSGVKFAILTAEYQDYERLLRDQVRGADVIFCCTPATEPLFPPEMLVSGEGKKKGRLVAAIGSYKPHMIELHPDVLRHAVAPPHGHHHHKHAQQGGVVVVDTLEGARKESGEVRQAGLKGEEMVEVGELVMLRKMADAEKVAGKVDKEGDGGLLRWLQDGNVVYKSVGIGLMDVVVGAEMVKLANRRGVGTVVPHF
ncbi:MAG: hypothetical protein M1824_006030 [Vezdaea acicularis]|nr:MAG: hypothetical protein M1824_006030 [Vezdaea acicularis]